MLLAGLLATGILVPITLARGEESAASFPITITLGEELIHSISLRSNGASTTAAWVESQLGQPDSIHFLTFPDGPLVDLPSLEIIRAPGRHGLILTPDFAIHPQTGIPAFTWISEGESGSRVYFAKAGEEPTIVFTSVGALEFPVLEYDNQGTAHITWFETSGGSSHVYLARRDGRGGWGAFPVSHGGNSYDILPQLFPREAGVDLYWFSILGGETITQKATYTPQGLSHSTPPLEHLPLNRWPVFYNLEGFDLLGALWLEQTPEGEIYFDLDPRNVPNPSPVPLGDPSAILTQVSVSVDPYAAKSWLELVPDGQDFLYAFNPDNGVEIYQPALAPIFESAVSSSDAWLNLLWLEEDVESGLLLLRFTRAQ